MSTHLLILQIKFQGKIEFSLGATSVSDLRGICVTGFIEMTLKVFLCRWQTKHGRDFCTKL
jgi:battenin